MMGGMCLSAPAGTVMDVPFASQTNLSLACIRINLASWELGLPPTTSRQGVVLMPCAVPSSSSSTFFFFPFPISRWMPVSACTVRSMRTRYQGGCTLQSVRTRYEEPTTWISTTRSERTGAWVAGATANHTRGGVFHHGNAPQVNSSMLAR